MRSFIRFSVLDEIFCGFAVFSDFLRGFSVSNRPPCPPLLVKAIFRVKTVSMNGTKIPFYLAVNHIKA